jgi:thiamine-phosphate pyrophosphorylase
MPPVGFRLLVVTDRHQTRGRSLSTVLHDVLASGAPALQIRERDLPTPELIALTQQIQAMTVGRSVQLLMNERIDLVLALDLAGVHLRSDSLPVLVARRLLGAHRLVGRSTHSLEEVRQANREGADYVVFGPVFDTASKKEFGPALGVPALESVCRDSRIPVFAIGGIDAGRVPAVRRAGAYGVALIAAILSHGDSAAATTELLAALQ